jgi:NAD(P)-dependent dehydrogenase (short-subunit alcohol dehydrogenase family)
LWSNSDLHKGAVGIGACLVRLLHEAGAHVFFGDVLEEPAQALEKELHSSEATVEFIPCNVTSYSDNLTLFNAAYQAFGRVDHAISNAGLGEQENLVSPDLTLESVREEPTNPFRVVDVNLKGPLYFARLASVYLRQQAKGEMADATPMDKSLIFTSSVAAFREDPGLYVYVASKHGVMGLMRVLRRYLMCIA